MTINRIFGIGLSHTGTRSLNRALNMLGFPSAHWPLDRHTFQELSTGVYKLSLLEKYRGLTDITASPFFAQFDKVFPNSKFILTARDKESWLQKMSNLHVHPGTVSWMRTRVRWQQLRMEVKGSGGWVRFVLSRKFPQYFMREGNRIRSIEFQRVATYGAIWFQDPDRLSYVYDAHLKNVQDYFADRPQDLLVLNVCEGEGWEKLCPFLDRECPGQPFPHVR